MKVLFISRGLGAGGAQKVLSFVANTYSDAGHDVIIFEFIKH